MPNDIRDCSLLKKDSKGVGVIEGDVYVDVR